MAKDDVVITGLGGLDNNYDWISGNVEGVLGVTAEEMVDRKSAVLSLFPDGPTYGEILAEEKQRQAPRVSFRSWLVKVQNEDEPIPLGVTALFLRGDDGALQNVAGAAWPCMDWCPVCSKMFPMPAALRRAVLGLVEATAASL